MSHGTLLMGASSYADDIVTPAPTIISLSKLLEAANKFSKEYNAKFNTETN